MTSAILALGALSIAKSLMRGLAGANEAGSFSIAFASTSFGSLISGLQNLGNALTTTSASATAAGGAFSALWTIMKAHPLGAILTAVAAVAGVVTAIQKIAGQSQKELKESMQEASSAADEWVESNDEINGYIERVEELRDAIDSGTLSEEEAYDAKSELLSIQDSLVESYGNTAEGIDLVNGAYEEQIELMGKIADQDANNWLNDYSEEYELAADKIHEQQTYILGEADLSLSEQGEALKDILSEYSDYISYAEEGQTSIIFQGTASEYSEIADNLITDIREAMEGFSDEELTFNPLLDRIYEAAKDYQDEVEEFLGLYENTWDEGIQATLEADDHLYTLADSFFDSEGTYHENEKVSKEAKDWINDLAEAIDEYNEAIISGDQQAIADASESYNSAIRAVDMLFENPRFSEKYSDYIGDLIDGLDDGAIAANDFYLALTGKGNMERAEDIYSWAQILQGYALSDVDLQAMVSTGRSSEFETDASMLFWDIADAAEAANIPVETLITLMTEAGVVASRTIEDVEPTGTFSEMLGWDDLTELIDNFQSDIDKVNSSLDSLRNGEEVNIADLIQDYPELIDSMDDLEAGLNKIAIQTLQDFGAAWNSTINNADLSMEELAKASEYYQELMHEVQVDTGLSQYSGEFREAYGDIAYSLKQVGDAFRDSNGMLVDEFGTVSEMAEEAGYSIDDYTEAFENYTDVVLNNLLSGRTQNKPGNPTDMSQMLYNLLDYYNYNELAMEAILTLSVNPDASTWKWQEWIDNIGDQEIYIQLNVEEETLTELQDALDALETEQDLLESSQSLSEAMGIKKTVRDYRDLINNSKKQAKNLNDQNKSLQKQKELYESIGLDTKDIESQINSNTMSIRSALEDQIEWNTEALALNYNQAAEAISTAQSALSESTSDTLLSDSTIKDIMDIYSELDGYDAEGLFMQTASGVDINTEALKNLEKEYANMQRQKYDQQISDLGKEYQETEKYIDSLGDAFNDLSKSEQDALLTAAGYTPLDQLQSDITYAELLRTELDGLTSAYQTWINASSSGNQREAYENMQSYYETAGDLITRGWYNNEGLNAYLDLMLSAEERTGNVLTDYDKLTQKIEGTNHSLMDYFTVDEDGNSTSEGAWRFADDIIQIMGEEYGKINEETGLIEFEPWTEEDVQAIADRFGTTSDVVYKMIDAMQEAGFAVESYEDYLQDAFDVTKQYQEKGTISPEINLDPQSAEETKQTIEDLENEKIEIEADTSLSEEDKDEVISSIDALIDEFSGQEIELKIKESINNGDYTLDQIGGMSAEEFAETFEIDTEVHGMDEIQSWLDLIHQAAMYENVQTSINTVIENGESADSLLEGYAEAEAEGNGQVYIETELGVTGEEEVAAALELLQQLQDESITYDMTVKIDEEQFEVLTGQDAEGTIDYEVGEVPTEIEEHATGFVDYEVGEVPAEIEEHAKGLADYDIGLYPDNVPEIPGLADYDVGKYPDSVPNASGLVDYEVGEVPTEIEEHAKGLVDYDVDPSSLSTSEISISADTTQVGEDVIAVIGDIESQEPEISVSADTTQVGRDVIAVIGDIEAQTPELAVSADTTQVGEDVVAVISDIESLEAKIPISTDIDISVITDLATALNSLSGGTVNIATDVSGVKAVNDLNTSIEQLCDKTVQAIAEVSGTVEVRALKSAIDSLYSKSVDVKASVFGEEDVRDLAREIASVQSKTVTVTSITQNITQDYAGTAHAEGTSSLKRGWEDFKKVGGSYIKGAYAGGSWQDWSLHSDEDALVNELGTESIVFKMRLYTVMCIENLFNCWEIVKPIKL